MCFLGVEVAHDVANRQALARDHTIEVPLMHIEGALPFAARDREPGVGTSAAGQWAGDGFHAVRLELRQDLTDEGGLALKR